MSYLVSNLNVSRNFHKNHLLFLSFSFSLTFFFFILLYSVTNRQINGQRQNYFYILEQSKVRIKIDVGVPTDNRGNGLWFINELLSVKEMH